MSLSKFMMQLLIKVSIHQLNLQKFALDFVENIRSERDKLKHVTPGVKLIFNEMARKAREA